MGHPIVSLKEARRLVKETGEHLIWIEEREAVRFCEPGWVELLPHRDGGVLFINNERKSRAERAAQR
ncbi:MAG TPA: hypothetical protein VGM29_03100 [Polyangiaceae bacterium]|jgi:hypothetical protein